MVSVSIFGHPRSRRMAASTNGTDGTSEITMLKKIRRAHWLLAVAAVVALVTILVPRLRIDRPAVPAAARNLEPAKPKISLPAAAPAAVENRERKRYIVQAQSTDAARDAVREAGGAVTADLGVIRAVGAALDERELAALRDRHDPGLRIFADTPVTASSVTGALPETYYPSEIDASELHIGGVTGGGVTVAVIDSGLWNQQGPLQYSPMGGRSRVLAQYDVIQAREQPGYAST